MDHLSRLDGKRGVYENPAGSRPAPGCARHRGPSRADSPGETHSTKGGEINIDVQTSHSERVSTIVSAALIAAGTALTMAGAHAGSRKIEDNGARRLERKKGTL
jgi:hypothetical protein